MIDVRGISKTFHRGAPNEVTALRGVSLRLEAGEWATVVGSNGAGKSTLLNVLAGEEMPDKGTVIIDGRDVTRMPEHKRAHLVGRVFQNPGDGTAAWMRVEENLCLALLRGRRHGLRTGVSDVRRRLIAEKYAPYIDAVYAGDAEVKVSTAVTYEDGRQRTVRSRVRIEDAEREVPAHV